MATAATTAAAALRPLARAAAAAAAGRAGAGQRSVTLAAAAAAARRAASSKAPGAAPAPQAPRYDDQPAPVWPSDPTPLPDFQLRPPPRPDEPLEAKRRRLLYQSRKRGILENDILLGTFAARYLPELSAEELALYDDMLCENDWDIYYWATNAKPAPAKYEGRVLNAIREIAQNKDRRVQRQPDTPEFEQ